MSHDYAECKRSLECLFGLGAYGKIKILSTVSHRQSSGASFWGGNSESKLPVLIGIAYMVNSRGRTATAGSDVVQSGRPIFDDFFQHLWPYIGNNTANVVFQMVKRLWLIRIDQ
ncbi:hypothetical protein TNCV_4444991 [Trichonephila clavipes]|nr:hypothetical protein TNCV_4444991 [Trichonephila clavipes]